MSLQFILGSSGAGKTHFLYDTVIKEAAIDQDREYLVIVPEQFTLQTQKDLVTMHPDHGILNIDVLSFLRLAYHVFGEVGGNDRLVLEDTGKSMIVKKVVMENKDQLKLFGSNIRKQGFIEEMKSILSEFLQYSIHTEQLKQMQETVQNRGLLKSKLEDIITIYNAYEQFLKDRFINSEEILDVLCEVIDQSQKVKNSVIYLDGFTGFTPSQYQLLTHLMRCAKKVYITITLDKREYNRHLKEHELFYLSFHTMEKLTKLAQEQNIDILPDIFPNSQYKTIYRFRHSKSLAHLEHNLFRFPYQIMKEVPQEITITTAKTCKEEVKDMVITVLSLIKKQSYRYRDIAIVTGDMETYAPLIKEEVSRANIPCFIDQNRNILANPFIEFIRSAIEIAEHNFTYESVMRFLKCGMVSIDPVSLYQFENYIIARGIRGASRYQEEWEGQIYGTYPVELDKINAVRSYLNELLTDFCTVQKGKDTLVRDRILSLYHLIISCHCEQQLLETCECYKQEQTDEGMQNAKEYEQIYRSVMDLFDSIIAILGDEQLDTKEFKEIIETGLKEAKVGVIPPGVDQIVVGDIERTRLKDIKILFFIGVNDGIIPKADVSGGILSDMDRQLFQDHEIELAPTKRQNAYMTEFYLYLNLTKPSDHLYLSYARLNNAQKGIRASYLIGKLQKLFPSIQIREALQLTGELASDLKTILSTDCGMEYLIAQLRDYIEGEEGTLFHELYSLYLNETLSGRISIQKILDGVFYKNKETGLSAVVAKELYSKVLLGSVTRMERYAACAFAHFLEFGLRLKERKEYTISVPDIGTIFHKALELFSLKLKENNYSWNNITKEQEVTLGKESVEEAVKNFGSSIINSTKRNEYLVHRIERILLKTVDTLSEQLKSGRFEPVWYEKFFAHEDRYLNLHGQIDRVDLYEKDGTLFIKVVDYKSGSTSFDLMSLYYGLQLQLGVYLSATIKMIKEEYPNENIIPAGVFYYNLDDPIVPKSDHVKEDIEKKLRMNGIVNSSKDVIPYMDQKFLSADGCLSPSVKSTVIPVETSKEGEITKRSSVATREQFQQLQTYIGELMHSFSIEIMEGSVRHNPYKSKQQCACNYCRYQSVCGFDCKLEGYQYHKLKSMTDDEVLQSISEEEEIDGGSELDK